MAALHDAKIRHVYILRTVLSVVACGATRLSQSLAKPTEGRVIKWYRITAHPSSIRIPFHFSLECSRSPKGAVQEMPNAPLGSLALFVSFFSCPLRYLPL
jgi:hypothetical protein